VPRDPAQAFKVAIETQGRALDVGFLGDRHFLNIAGVGFDAAVAAAFNNRPKRGKAGYLTGTLRGVWGYTTSVYRFESEPHTVEGPCFLLAFANCRQYGSGIVIAPNADPSDGLLDLVVVAGGSPLVQFWRARRLGFRRTAPARGVTRGRITSARVAGEYLLAHVDGQTFEARGELSVRVVPRGMLVAAP
jgi:diacylglycerol kinase family enzyme